MRLASAFFGDSMTRKKFMLFRILKFLLTCATKAHLFEVKERHWLQSGFVSIPTIGL